MIVVKVAINVYYKKMINFLDIEIILLFFIYVHYSNGKFYFNWKHYYQLFDCTCKCSQTLTILFNFVGRILWSRQLFRRVEEPMLELKHHPQLMQSNEAKKIIRNYNKLSKTLLEYELMYYRCWLSEVQWLCLSYFVVFSKNIKQQQ